jgi:lysozyme
MNKPRAKQFAVMAAAVKVWVRAYPDELLPPMFVVGIRGYYRDTMGAKGKNDRGIYDDAIFVVGPETFAAFNANTDPSRHRPGIASLISGVHPYKPGNHGISKPGGGYPAFRPNTKGEVLPVMRDGQDGIKQGIAINIHKGSRNSTSSLGCQTLPPAQWDAFYALTRSEMKKAGQKNFDYILCDGPIV